jgi:hypothetical protein
MAWNTAGTKRHTALAALAKEMADTVDPDDQPWQCVILRAVFHPGEHYIDPELRHFDARFEVTRYPTDLLWGPGLLTDAAAWFAEHQPEPDQCDYLDRAFVVRVDGDQLYLPMRPLVAAALPNGERTGTWYAIKADHPRRRLQPRPQPCHEGRLRPHRTVSSVSCRNAWHRCLPGHRSVVRLPQQT